MPRRRDHSRRLLGFARDRRLEETDAERKLWQLLRDRRLGGFKFRRQVPISSYIVDFFCADASLAVELDGGQHDEPAAVVYDARRTDALREVGVRVIRFWDHEVLRDPDAVARTIYRELTGEAE